MISNEQFEKTRTTKNAGKQQSIAIGWTFVKSPVALGISNQLELKTIELLSEVAISDQPQRN